VPEEVAIEAAIKGLCIGPFAAHLAREKPASMHELYHEFEKYCRSDNDYRKRLEDQNSQKRQSNDRNSQKKSFNQDERRPQREASGPMMNIEQPKSDRPEHNRPPAETRNSERRPNQAGRGGRNAGWPKNQISSHGSNIASSMGRRRVTPPGIALMQRKLRRGSRAGQLRNLRHQLLNLGR